MRRSRGWRHSCMWACLTDCLIPSPLWPPRWACRWRAPPGRCAAKLTRSQLCNTLLSHRHATASCGPNRPRLARVRLIRHLFPDHIYAESADTHLLVP